MHEYRARYEAALSIARQRLFVAYGYAVSMGDEGAAWDLQTMRLSLDALMKESLERKTRKPLRRQLPLEDAAIRELREP